MIKKWLRNTSMGYIPGQAGIMRRMLREEDRWQSHLVKTSEFIQQVVNNHKPKSIRILGSGWLLDVPINYLMESCEKIILTDIVHPYQIINKFSRIKNIEFETIDITGGVVDLAHKQNKKKYNHDLFIQQIERINQNSYEEDLVISVNLLSQLSIILTDYLTKKLSLTHTQIVEIAEAIQKRHLELLPINKSVLISDFEEEYYDEDDKFIGSKPTVFIPLPKVDRKEWSWNFDTKMMYKEDCKTMLKIVAVCN